MSQNHSILIPLADKQVPLFLFRDSVNLLLQLFKLTGYPSLRIGYDSMRADCAAITYMCLSFMQPVCLRNIFNHKSKVTQMKCPLAKYFPLNLRLKKSFLGQAFNT